MIEVDIELPDVDGRTLLIIAAQNKNIANVRLLISLGADVDSTGGCGTCPLIAALIEHEIDQSSVEIMTLLLEAGADPNAISHDGSAAILLASHADAPSGVNAVERLIKSGADPHQIDLDGWSPLMFATRSGNVETVDMLLEAGAEVNHLSLDGNGALNLARQGSTAIQELLVQNGATCPAMTNVVQALTWNRVDNAHRLSVERNEDLLTPRNLAASVENWDSPALFSLLLNIHELDDARVRKLSECLLRMIDCGRLLSAMTVLEGVSGRVMTERLASLLCSASSKGLLQIISQLIGMGVDVNAPDADGLTPLMWAAYDGRTDAVPLLLQSGADPRVRSPKTNLSAKEYALLARHTDLCRLL